MKKTKTDIRFTLRITAQEEHQLKEMAHVRGGINRQNMIRYLIRQAYKSHVQVQVA